MYATLIIHHQQSEEHDSCSLSRGSAACFTYHPVTQVCCHWRNRSCMMSGICNYHIEQYNMTNEHENDRLQACTHLSTKTLHSPCSVAIWKIESHNESSILLLHVCWESSMIMLSSTGVQLVLQCVYEQCIAEGCHLHRIVVLACTSSAGTSALR